MARKNAFHTDLSQHERLTALTFFNSVRDNAHSFYWEGDLLSDISLTLAINIEIRSIYVGYCY